MFYPIKMQKSESINKQAAFIYWCITFGYMGVIFYLSSIRGLPFSIMHIDKIFHAGVYALLSILSYISFRKSGVRKHIFLISFAFAVLYGITDELHQFHVPGREASLGDVIADAVGGFSGCSLAHLIIFRN